MDILIGLAATIHLGLQGTYNETHPHIRAEYESFVAGSYYNSNSDFSHYAGYEFQHDMMFLEIGGVTGYYDQVMPYFRAGIHKNNMKLFVAPAVEGDTIGMVVGVEVMLGLRNP